MRYLLVDITRTIVRAAHSAPTGIDRVERAYVEWALAQERYEVAFISRIRGGQAVFTRDAGVEIVEEAAERPVRRSGFGETRFERRWGRIVAQARALRRATRWFRSPDSGRAALEKIGLDPRETILINVSHNNIEPRSLELMRGIGIGRVVVFVHDVIPVDYPEFVVHSGARKFAEKLDALADHADGLIFNSAYTAERTLARLAERTMREPASIVAHLGLNDFWSTPYLGPVLSTHPYFVTLGTIEPRKNHLLLLNLWRRLTELEADPPHLHVIGWRGWENENILDFLDRSSVMGRTVFEHPSDSDERVKGWIAGARAALYPTFVEGFGIPVAEALASGTPVICSDLPVLREVGGAAPEYVDPLDGPGWMRKIVSYAKPDCQDRAAQLDRIKTYAPATWDAHMEAVDGFLAQLDQN